jgi:hypothetical protein
MFSSNVLSITNYQLWNIMTYRLANDSWMERLFLVCGD